MVGVGGGGEGLLASQPNLVGERHNKETLSQRKLVAVLKKTHEVDVCPIHRCIHTRTCTPHVQTHMYTYIKKKKTMKHNIHNKVFQDLVGKMGGMLLTSGTAYLTFKIHDNAMVTSFCRYDPLQYTVAKSVTSLFGFSNEPHPGGNVGPVAFE